MLASYVDIRDVTHPAQLTGFRFLDDYDIRPPRTNNREYWPTQMGLLQSTQEYSEHADL
jgi:hypothetical protein